MPLAVYAAYDDQATPAADEQGCMQRTPSEYNEMCAAIAEREREAARPPQPSMLLSCSWWRNIQSPEWNMQSWQQPATAAVARIYTHLRKRICFLRQGIFRIGNSETEFCWAFRCTDDCMFIAQPGNWICFEESAAPQMPMQKIAHTHEESKLAHASVPGISEKPISSCSILCSWTSSVGQQVAQNMYVSEFDPCP